MRHTLIVIDYGQLVQNDNQIYRYRLLELVDAKNGIEIHDVKGQTEIEVLVCNLDLTKNFFIQRLLLI